MRWSVLSALALLVVGTVASPVKEESSMTVDVAEIVTAEDSHFIVSVQRTDDVKEDSGELIAEKVSNIVFDFKVDQEAEALLINGYALKLIPQRVRKVTFLAAVIPPNHPSLPSPAECLGSIKTPEIIDALNKLERNGLVTADVDLFITYEGDVRNISIRVQVVEVEGEEVIHKDLLSAQITLPQHHRTIDGQGHHHPHPHSPHGSECPERDWVCRAKAWLKSLTAPCGTREGPRGHHRPGGYHRGGQHGDPGGYHRHRFNHPRRHGFMKFIISVVIPVLIGAAAGVGIGILSVFVAEIVGGIILRVRGRRNAEYVEVDTKDSLDGQIEEDLPVYEAVEETSMYSDEKH